MIILVGGGSRSGKSRKALEIARRYGPRRGVWATAQAFDDEMAVRAGDGREAAASRSAEISRRYEPHARCFAFERAAIAEGTWRVVAVLGELR